MNARQINSTLHTSAAVCAAAALVSLLLALVWPLKKQAADVMPGAGSPATHAATKNDLPPLAAFEPIWSMRLRQNLGTAPPPSVAAAPMPTPAASTSVPVTLVGTIGTSLAMLRTPSNVVEVCGVGESVGGVEVLAVRPAEVDVTFNGRKITLVKPPEPEQ
jgi:hypothetical protein